jgi:transglutaminase-like putative cysteine protease
MPKSGNVVLMSETDSSLAISVGCDFIYEATHETPALFLVRPNPVGQSVLEERWEATPHVAVRDYVDIYGNPFRRLILPVGGSKIRYDATVEVSAAPDPLGAGVPQMSVADLPDDVLHYTLPSRFCPSDLLVDTAWQLFGATSPSWERVQAICDFVHNRIQFAYGSSIATTSALDVFEKGTGVCRDFAHLAVTFCRAMNVPARYVFGYLPDIDVPLPDAPMDFCAWFEAYLGDRWWTFDPRNNQRRVGRVVIARGRDALDVAMVTSYGSAQLIDMVVRADKRE